MDNKNSVEICRMRSCQTNYRFKHKISTFWVDFNEELQGLNEIYKERLIKEEKA